MILWTDFCPFPLPLHFSATRLALHYIIILMTDKVDDKAELELEQVKISPPFASFLQSLVECSGFLQCDCDYIHIRMTDWCLHTEL